MLIVSLPLAIALTGASRFIHHTDREYSHWISVYGESAIRMEDRCSALKSASVCGAAQQRRAFVTKLQSYRDRITAWRWPAFALLLLSWLAVIISVFAGAREFLRPQSAKNQNEHQS